MSSLYSGKLRGVDMPGHNGIDGYQFIAVASARRASGRFATEKCRTAVILIQAVEDPARAGEGFLVGTHHGQCAEGDVEAGGFGGVVAFVVEVGFVDDLGDAPQHRVGDLVAAQDGFEAAISVVVRQVDTTHVERGRIHWYAGS